MPMAAGFEYAISSLSGSGEGYRLAMDAAAAVWPTVFRPSLDAIKALDGKLFAMLSVGERQVFDFYRDQGRKYGVIVGISPKGSPDELIVLKPDQSENVQRTNNRVRVVVS